MATTKTKGSDSKTMERKEEVRVEPPEGGIKTEVVDVKTEGEGEVGACLVCGARCGEAVVPDDAVLAVLARHGASVGGDAGAGLICRSCCELVDVLERAEREYLRLKRVFDAVLARNPAYAPRASSPAADVKTEDMRVPRSTTTITAASAAAAADNDSEDEPLANTKKRRITRLIKGKKKKQKPKPKLVIKQKLRLNEESWECDECGTGGTSGGALALATHKLTEHTIGNLTAIKTEDSERSQSPFDNGLENGLGDDVYLDFDDDNDKTYVPDDLTLAKSRSSNKERKKSVKMKKIKPTEWYPCDQCNARYSTKTRLEQHKQKHDGSKPPYICEVCGAHYKHKRACDIHIKLHKGISDWKCEECNKLFPSKSALQRHNNIHTGELNYQCDLCGKSFIHTSSFKMHKLSHSGVKPHSCDVCGLALMTRSHLNRHKRIHSGEKRHECAVCGKRFSERYNLVAHAKSHETPGVTGAPGAGAPAGAGGARRLFRCHFCAERFERRYMLERHVSAAHGRTLERPPATPRNTMSKLLKAQAMARRDPPAPAPSPSAPAPAPAPTTRAAAASSKLLASLTSTTSSLLAGGSWSGAYAAEFGIRTDFPH